MSAESAPNELRLVWLFEILVANVFNLYADINFIKTPTVGKYYTQYDYGLLRALGNYRNDFVHYGTLSSRKTYVYLEECCKEQIEALALEYDIELDWNYTIYHKEV